MARVTSGSAIIAGKRNQGKPRMTPTLTKLATLITTIAALGACTLQQPSPSRAQNVILFIGDGMGVSTVTAGRIYAGQKAGKPGEEHMLSFDAFENVALVKTYNTNQQVPGSAGTATAMMTGEKTRAGVINVGTSANRGDCEASLAVPLTTLGKIARDRGLKVGVVSTARLTHATPATVYGHAPERNWESDYTVPGEAAEAGCRDLASQLVAFAPDVALGGGARMFETQLNGGTRGTDILSSWESAGNVVARTADEMVGASSDGKMLGLFSGSHMTYTLDRRPDTTEPTLTEMTTTAIRRLQGETGFFLMVESGRIDHGHHMGKAGYALEETVEFSNAIAAALAATDAEDTLVLVTADHSHVFTIAGYPTRGNPILGFVHTNNERGEPVTEPALAQDGIPYTTLGYMNGPGAVRGERGTPETGPMATQQALVPTGSERYLSETHAGEDVALYGTGPGAERVRGVIEQSEIYNIMVRALGWDEGDTKK